MIKNLLSIFFLFVCGYSSAQIHFVENKGQWDEENLYQASIPGGFLIIEEDALLITRSAIIHPPDFHGTHAHGFLAGDTLKCHTVKLNWINSSLKSHEGKKKLDAYHNYFIGNDPAKWASHVALYEEVLLKDLYPGIDLQILGTNTNQIKYNFLVHPGANPELIKWTYEGEDFARINEGNLEVGTSLGTQIEESPYAYQLYGKNDPAVPVSFKESQGVFAYSLPNSYNKNQELIIDPVLVFSTYTGSFSDNFGFTATYDSKGNAYAGGDTRDKGTQFWPTSPGAFQKTFGGGTSDQDKLLGDLPRDCAIMKLAPDGKTLIYATYLGGSKNEQPHSMVVDNGDHLFILGTTFSTDFPNLNSGAQKTHQGDCDVFVAKLSSDGTQLLGMTFIGGSGRDGLNGKRSSNLQLGELAYNFGDEFRGEIFADKNGGIYVASSTESSAAQGFPVKNGFNNSFGGEQDGFVAKLTNDLTQIDWCSYIGGSSEETCYGVGVDSKLNVFVCGGTNSINLGFNVNGVNKANNGGKADGYVLKISPNGKSLLAGTYIGTSSYDQCHFVQIDKYDQVYVTGQTAGAIGAFPANVFSEPDGGQFIFKLDNDLKNILIQSTFGGGNIKPQLSPTAFLVDSCERIFFCGWGGSTNSTPLGHGGNTAKMTVTPDALKTVTDRSDFYLVVFTKGMKKMLYATFIGGGTTLNELHEHVDGGTSRFDPKGVVYHSVCAGCGGGSTPDFPTTPGAYSTTNNSPNCNNAIFKIDLENLNQAPEIRDTIITFTAGEHLKFNYTVYDPDDDSVFIEYSGTFIDDPNVLISKPSVVNPSSKGLQSLTHTWNWTTNCEHVGLDTVVIKAIAHDEGCPDYKTDTAYIKLVIVPPPAPFPPDVICMTFTSNDELKLTWKMPDSNIYLDKYILYKSSDGGPWTPTDTVGKTNSFSKKDQNTPQNTQIDYCYKIVGLNACGKPGDTSYTICSIDQSLSPIKPAEIYTTTVVQDKEVHTYWYKSNEPDFRGYEVWKKTNQAGNDFELLKEIKDVDDTLFIDKDVEVNLYSYCYILKVEDKCQNSSFPSNEGCSILLQGESIPYQHNLKWSEYSQWTNGVSEYKLVRHDDRQITSPVQYGDGFWLNTIDTSLDYDWGAYWYKIQAQELNGNNAESESNEILLIQKPLLHVPTAFTPNGDIHNQVWGIVDVFVKDYKLLVYNRWGQKVLETSDKNYQWDGYFVSEDPFDNVYIWYVVYTGWDHSSHTQKGTLTILR